MTGALEAWQRGAVSSLRVAILRVWACAALWRLASVALPCNPPSSSMVWLPAVGACFLVVRPPSLARCGVAQDVYATLGEHHDVDRSTTPLRSRFEREKMRLGLLGSWCAACT